MRHGPAHDARKPAARPQRREPEARCARCAAAAALPYAALPLHAAERGGGRGEGESDAPRLPGPKLNAEAEREFDKNPACLSQFNVFKGTPLLKRIDAQMCGFEAPFTVFAGFKPPCPCGQLEYRQFIRGHIVRDPEGAAEDRGDLLSKLPEGRLWRSYQEDGDTSADVQRYGHRSNPAVERENLTDRYLDAQGRTDQAKGCRYEGADTPWAVFRSRPGEVWDIELEFHGDIVREGTPIARRFWKAISGRFTAP